MQLNWASLLFVQLPTNSLQLIGMSNSAVQSINMRISREIAYQTNGAINFRCDVLLSRARLYAHTLNSKFPSRFAHETFVYRTPCYNIDIVRFIHRLTVLPIGVNILLPKRMKCLSIQLGLIRPVATAWQKTADPKNPTSTEKVCAAHPSIFANLNECLNLVIKRNFI